MSRVISLIVVLGFLAQPVSARADWQAGAAKIAITPPDGMWMSGYAARKKPAEGKRHDLWAKALVIDDGQGKRVVLVTLDIVGIPRDMSRRICAELKKKHKFDRADIALTCSHTHTGPVLRNNLFTMYELDDKQVRMIKEYSADLEKRVVEVVGAAIKKLEKAIFPVYNGKATFAVNRRNNKEADVPKLREADKLKGPSDHDVPILAIAGEKSGVKAIVFGYACHATVLSDYQWSGDYPGYAQVELEKKHPGAIALFWAGCGGDQNPLPRRKVELAEKYGQELADAVSDELKQVRVGSRLPRAEGDRIHTTYAEIDLPYGELPSRDKLLEDSMSKNRYIAARAKHLLEQLKAKGSLAGTYPYPIQVWRLGGVTWIFLGGEVVVDYSLRLKKELKGIVWVTGYANDVMAYIPSLRVLREGGYEGASAMIYYGLPAPWGPKVEEMIVKAVQEQVKKVQPK